MPKAKTFSEALTRTKQRHAPSRFVETGEGLRIERAGKKLPKGMVSIEDILLDQLEEQEANAVKDKAK